MIAIRQQITQRQAELAKHAFFQRLAASPSPDEVLGFIAAPTFFVMTFQDILRLNESKIVDEGLLRIARRHRQEDVGHDDWFLHDLKVIEGWVPEVRWLFSADHENTRDVAFELISEVFRAEHDHTRIVLVLVLEAGGHVMFSRMADYLERCQDKHQLRYFSRGHLNVELDHNLFEDDVDALLDQIVLPPSARAEAEAVVERGFRAMQRLLDGFERRVIEKARAAS